MKKTPYIFALIALFMVFMGCKNEDSYSNLQKKEKKTIEAYILRNNIQVVKQLPATWGKNVYYETPSGLYIHMVSEGESAVSIENSNKSNVGFRTLEYQLNENKDIISDKTNPNAYPYPDVITYGDISSATPFGMGMYEAISIMKNEKSKAKLIVPSNLNTSSYSNYLIPVGYDVEITVIN